MVHLLKNICDTRIIPPECREQFLPLDSPGGLPLKQLQVSLAGISDLAAGYRIGREDPWFHVLLYTLKGRAVFETPEAALTLTPGQLLVLPAHESYAYGVSTGSWRILWFHLSLRKTWHSLEAHRWHVRRSHEVAALLAAAEGFLRETERSGEAAPRLALLYTEVLSHLLRREVAAGLDPHARHLDEQLWMLWRVVASDLAHPWSVHELARHVHMSPGHFHRVMSRNYQITPMRKVVELRMQRAAALLAHTDESVAKIGAEVGYDDAFAFSVAFKRYHAMSPRSFRNDAAGASQA